MSLSKEEKEEFFKAIYTVAQWVKNCDDFLKYDVAKYLSLCYNINHSPQTRVRAYVKQ